MATIEVIVKLCTDLVRKHGIELLRIAATKQLAESVIESSTMCDIKQTIISKTMLAVYSKRAIDTGYTLDQLDMALKCIRLAGEAVHHVSAVSKPITIEPCGVVGGVLHNVMYPRRLRVEKGAEWAHSEHPMSESSQIMVDLPKLTAKNTKLIADSARLMNQSQPDVFGSDFRY